jgi:pimeloyl-ACP methyl ester carboxylesterase
MPLKTASTYDQAGPQSGKPIVFVHGIRLSRKMWLPQMEILSDCYRVIALDLPGHGALVETPFTLESAAKQIAEVIDQAAGGRALVVGLSLGGYSTMEFARLFPEKAAGLVLAGCSANPTVMATVPFRLASAMMASASEKLIARINDWIFRWRFDPIMIDPVIQDGYYFQAMPQAVKELSGKNFIDKMRGFPGPVLFLNGAHDWLFRSSEAAFLAAAKNSRLELIPNAGHLSNLEQPEAFAEAVRRFAMEVLNRD